VYKAWRRTELVVAICVEALFPKLGIATLVKETEYDDDAPFDSVDQVVRKATQRQQAISGIHLASGERKSSDPLECLLNTEFELIAKSLALLFVPGSNVSMIPTVSA
jgi:hypothetical protein